MNLKIITLMIDTALVTLIWLVQLVIYPGFCFYTEENIKKWHSLYTTRITYIVMPLMLGQLTLYIFVVYSNPVVSHVLNLGLVLFIWIVTFFISVPLHAKIDAIQNTLQARKKLVQTNWLRTIGWTLILIINIINYGQ